MIEIEKEITKKNYGKYMRDDGAKKLKAYLAGKKRDLKSMRRDDVSMLKEARDINPDQKR